MARVARVDHGAGSLAPLENDEWRHPFGFFTSALAFQAREKKFLPEPTAAQLDLIDREESSHSDEIEHQRDDDINSYHLNTFVPVRLTVATDNGAQ